MQNLSEFGVAYLHRNGWDLMIWQGCGNAFVFCHLYACHINSWQESTWDVTPASNRQKHPVQTSAAWHIYWLPCHSYSQYIAIVDLLNLNLDMLLRKSAYKVSLLWSLFIRFLLYIENEWSMFGHISLMPQNMGGTDCALCVSLPRPRARGARARVVNIIVNAVPHFTFLLSTSITLLERRASRPRARRLRRGLPAGPLGWNWRDCRCYRLSYWIWRADRQTLHEREREEHIFFCWIGRMEGIPEMSLRFISTHVTTRDCTSRAWARAGSSPDRAWARGPYRPRALRAHCSFKMTHIRAKSIKIWLRYDPKC